MSSSPLDERVGRRVRQVDGAGTSRELPNQRRWTLTEASSPIRRSCCSTAPRLLASDGLNPSVYVLNQERPKPIVIARGSAEDPIGRGFGCIDSPRLCGTGSLREYLGEFSAAVRST
jgi:hypothetical protein